MREPGSRAPMRKRIIAPRYRRQCYNLRGRNASSGFPLRIRCRDDGMASETEEMPLAQAFEQARALDGSMSERLNLFIDGVRAHQPHALAVVDRLVARLRTHQAGEGAPAVGDA